LTALPLGTVILLCCLMMGWASHAFQHHPADDSSGSGPVGLVAQAATLPEQAPRAELSPQAMPHAETDRTEAAFERLHISHARINVPR
jgi:hypothetical protein